MTVETEQTGAGVAKGDGDGFRIRSRFTEPLLPRNFLPAALSALRGQSDAKSRIVFLKTVQSDAVKFAVVPIGQLAFRDKWMPELGVEIDDIILGPPVGAEAQNGLNEIAFRAAPAPPDNDGKSVILVIDFGIAFWNARFRTSSGGCRFREVQYLDFDTPTLPQAAAKVNIGFKDEAEIAALCSLADTKGHGAVVERLKTDFPASFFGSGADLDGLWHGTAMADLAGGANASDASGPIMFGLELPTSSIKDRGGDTLTAVLPPALAAGLEMTKNYSDRPLIIVLAFAFPAGPHDGNHQIAVAITDFLASQRAGKRDVTVMLPAGNHLQDRCCARLPANMNGLPAPSIIWHLPPDDFSANSVEIFVDAPDIPEVQLKAPDGRLATLTVAPGDLAVVELDGIVIGAVQHSPLPVPLIPGSKTKIRLSLSATAWQQPGQRPTPFGDWILSVAAQSPVDLWILRDDTSRDFAPSRPNRPSFFKDAAYRERSLIGDYGLDDTDTGALRRSGTASILTTAFDLSVVPVRANERVGTLAERQAFYSGKAYDFAGQTAPTMTNMWREELVDNGWAGRGADAVANGTARIFGVSGTSAAAALAARRQASKV
jgi:hypothetical protein